MPKHERRQLLLFGNPQRKASRDVESVFRIEDARIKADAQRRALLDEKVLARAAHLLRDPSRKQ